MPTKDDLRRRLLDMQANQRAKRIVLRGVRKPFGPFEMSEVLAVLKLLQHPMVFGQRAVVWFDSAVRPPELIGGYWPEEEMQRFSERDRAMRRKVEVFRGRSHLEFTMQVNAWKANQS